MEQNQAEEQWRNRTYELLHVIRLIFIKAEEDIPLADLERRRLNRDMAVLRSQIDDIVRSFPDNQLVPRHSSYR